MSDRKILRFFRNEFGGIVARSPLTDKVIVADRSDNKIFPKDGEIWLVERNSSDNWKIYVRLIEKLDPASLRATHELLTEKTEESLKKFQEADARLRALEEELRKAKRDREEARQQNHGDANLLRVNFEKLEQVDSFLAEEAQLRHEADLKRIAQENSVSEPKKPHGKPKRRPRTEQVIIATDSEHESHDNNDVPLANNPFAGLANFRDEETPQAK